MGSSTTGWATASVSCPAPQLLHYYLVDAKAVVAQLAGGSRILFHHQLPHGFVAHTIKEPLAQCMRWLFAQIINDPLAGLPVRYMMSRKYNKTTWCCWPRAFLSIQRLEKSEWIWWQWSNRFACPTQKQISFLLEWPRVWSVWLCSSG